MKSNRHLERHTEGAARDLDRLQQFADPKTKLPLEINRLIAEQLASFGEPGVKTMEALHASFSLGPRGENPEPVYQ